MSKGRRARLRQVHYNTATQLNVMHANPSTTTASQRYAVGLAQSTLAALLDLPCCEAEQSKPGDLYLESVRALVCTTGADEHPTVAVIQAVCREHAATKQPAEQPPPQPLPQPAVPASPARPPQPREGERAIKLGDDHLKHIGLKRGDYLYVQPASRELQVGELCALCRINADSWHLGIVEAVTLDVITMTEWGEARTFNRADLSHICRVTWKARRVKPVGNDCASKLARLKNRLNRLSEDGEITTCSARFKLEKQIYDLEREQARDEWAEVIGA